jgi:hypothetical protein
MTNARLNASPNRYLALVEKLFFRDGPLGYIPGATSVSFERSDIEKAAVILGIELPKNLGDVIYSMRYRIRLPRAIRDTEPEDREWVIVGTGRSRYAFRLLPINRIKPNPDLKVIPILDATPEIIKRYALSDEQALLAKVRYNRLIDIFLGLAAYSLQNHLRTSVRHIGQIEIDEIYVAVDREGRRYAIPVQAKGGNDQLGAVQTQQDIAFCEQRFSALICRPVAAQFMSDDVIAMFELVMNGEQLKIADEKHYILVEASEIKSQEIPPGS